MCFNQKQIVKMVLVRDICGDVSVYRNKQTKIATLQVVQIPQGLARVRNLNKTGNRAGVHIYVRNTRSQSHRKPLNNHYNFEFVYTIVTVRWLREMQVRHGFNILR